MWLLYLKIEPRTALLMIKGIEIDGIGEGMMEGIGGQGITEAGVGGFMVEEDMPPTSERGQGPEEVGHPGVGADPHQENLPEAFPRHLPPSFCNLERDRLTGREAGHLSATHLERKTYDNQSDMDLHHLLNIMERVGNNHHLRRNQENQKGFPGRFEPIGFSVRMRNTRVRVYWSKYGFVFILDTKI